MLAKNISKKVLSLFMTLVMLLGLMPTTALAVWDNQIMSGYYTFNQDGTPTGNTTSNPVTGTLENGGFTRSKTITQTGENAFDITLQVKTQQTVTSTEAAVILVIDTSGSMDDKVDNIKKINSAKASAKSFLDSLVSGNAGKIYVSVVNFATDAKTAFSWTDISVASNLTALKNKIDELSADGGTNLDGGLMLARNLLKMSSANIGGKQVNISQLYKYTVLLTDGEPTYYASDSNSTTNISKSSSSGDGSNTSEFDRNRPVARANEIKALTNSQLYTVCYGVGNNTLYSYKVGGFFGYWVYVTMAQYLRDEIATPAAGGNTYAYDVNSTAALHAAFQAIATSTTAGIDGQGAQVIDPMGQYIQVNEVITTGEDTTVTPDKKLLTWTLDPSTAQKSTSGGTTTYTYTLKYSVLLNTSAEGFEEGKYYPTNGYTHLDYEDNSLAFHVPGVKGEVPEYTYKVEYYKQNVDGSGYTQVDTYNGPKTNLHTVVSAPSGYEGKYTSLNYHFKDGNTTITIGTNEDDNVIKLYYDRDTANVTVNHFYKLTTINENGTTTVGEYPVNPDTQDSATSYVGDSYTAPEKLDFGGVTYALDSAKENNKTITVNADNAQNVINLYYTQEIDNRNDVTFSVDHVYRTHTWTLNDGTYELVSTESTVPNIEAGTQKAHTTYAASTAPNEGNEDFAYDTSSINSITLTDEGPNKITLYFDKTVDDRTPIDVTVNHHYTKTVKTVVDGVVVTVINPNDVVVTVPVTGKYAGESFTAQEVNTYNDEAYTPDSGNAGKLSVASLNSSNNVIGLHYTLLDEPGKTTVTVNHIYRTITHETVVTEDSEGNIIGTEVVELPPVVDDEVSSASEPLYVGELYTAARAGRDGYEFNEAKSDELSVKADTDGASVINLYYDKDTTKDERPKATIDVQHIYTTHLETIRDGKVEVIDVQSGTVTNQAHTGQAGDSFLAVEEPMFDDKLYTMIGAPTLGRVLQSGTNPTVVIHYERNDSDLVETSYTAAYIYKTYSMTVKDGFAGYHTDSAIENGTPVSNTETVYVGQSVTIPDGAQSGFDPYGVNPPTEQTLKSGSNEWTFTYAKYVPLPQVTVTVNHHYTTETIAVNGISTSNTEHENGTPVPKYLGESFVAAAALNGFAFDRYTVTQAIEATQDDTTKNVTVTADGNVVVDFYYTKTINNSKPTTYSIQHIYNTIDWDGKTTTSSPDPVTGTGFATNSITATLDPNGYTLVSATYNSSPLDAPYTIILAEGENTVVFTYKLEIDTRVDTKVKVVHEYYKKSTVTNIEEREYIYESVITGKEEHNVWVGGSYTAAKKPIYNEVTYEFLSANPDLTINPLLAVSEDDVIPNVITLKYVRTYTPDPNPKTGVEIPVTKQWVGPVGADSITVGLFRTTTANAPVLLTVETPVAEVTLTKDGGWAGTFGQWPTHDVDGNLYNYSVKEQSGDTWTDDTITFNGLTYDIAIERVEHGFHVINTIEPGSLDIRGEKLWANVSGITLPNEVTVRLYADGEPADREPQTLEGNSETSWHFSFSELPRYAGDGHEIVYTVKEAGEDANRRVTINGNTFQVSGGTKRTVIIEDESVEVYDLTNTYLTPNVPGPDPDPTPTPTPTPPETDIPDEETPLGPTIPDEETPLAPAPQPEPVIDDAEILEEVVPMGNLPQTGTAGLAVDPTVTLGALAVCLSMATAGLAIIVTGRKKKEETEN